jgi:PAS domain S-box-containing protein
MGERKRVMTLIFILTGISISITAITIGILYNAAFEESRSSMVNIAQSRARMIESVARYDADVAELLHDENPDYDPLAATLSQIVEAHNNFEGFGETGEFTLARHDSYFIDFLLRQRHGDVVHPHSIPFDSELAEPMRLALSGKSGTIIGLDYRGETVLAAYEPVSVLNLGIVAKIDLSEVRAPFIKASIAAVGVLTILIFFGAYLFARVTNPMVNQIISNESRFRSMFESRMTGIFFWNADGAITDANDVFLELIGYSREELQSGEVLWSQLTPPEHQARDDIELENLVSTGVAIPFEKEYFRKDGSRLPVIVGASTLPGSPLHGVAFVLDITDRKEANEELRRYAHIVSSSNDMMALLSSNYEYLSANAAYLKAFGLNREELIGKTASDVIGDAFFNSIVKPQAEHCMNGNEVRFQTWFDFPEALDRYIDVTYTPYLDKMGNVLGYVVNTHDITSLKLAEQKAAQYSRALESSLSEIYFVDAETLHFVEANLGARDNIGYSIEELRTITPLDITPDFTPEMFEKLVAPLRENEQETVQFTTVHRRMDGTQYPVELNIQLIPDENPIFLAIVQDITERIQAGESLAKNEKQFRSVVETAINCIISVDDLGRIVFMNKVTGKTFGYSSDELIGEPVTILMPDRYREAHAKGLNRVASGGETKVIGESVELAGLRKDGSEFPIELSLSKWKTDEGVFFTGIIRDITERNKSEQNLRDNESKFRTVIEQSNDAIYILFNEKFDLINRRFTELTGIELEELNLPDFNFMDTVAPEDKDLIIERGQMRDRGEQPPDVYEFSVLHKNGTVKRVQASVTEIEYRDGHAVLGLLRDINEQKALEEQLRQSQKMESVGRLAGGVAHDFNNMLQTIAGNCDLALQEDDLSEDLKESLAEIAHAAQRSAKLTRQLLSFARQETVEPKVIQLNDTVMSMAKMMQRLIGEEINLTWLPHEDIWKVKIDPSQIDQILVNLVVNARDAISGTGNITLATKNVSLDAEFASGHPGSRAGDYVMFTVSDDGCGMDSEVVSQIFEPFFTTKPLGEGTGLGLATIYGIVKQNACYIDVYSEVGIGTTFKLYIPRYVGDSSASIREKQEDILDGGTETILIVEDEESVLRLSMKILKNLGYTTITADTPAKALSLAEENQGQIHLLLSDVVMPDMNGGELGERISKAHPNLKILFMSGYTADIIANQGIVREGVNYIQKPFTAQDLAIKIRSVLEG